MELLVEKLSELLKVTIEKATEIYPIIRSQFIVYNVLDSLKTALIIVLVLTGITYVVMLIITLCSQPYPKSSRYFDEMETNFYNKCSKIAAITGKTTLFSIIVVTVLSILQYLLAPEMMMLLKLTE